MRPLLLMALALYLLGCSASPYRNTPQYVVPETRAKAAVQLNTALAGAEGLSEIWATEHELNWHQKTQLTSKRWIIVSRNLQFQSIRFVGRPHKPGELFELTVDADGGSVTFRFKNGLKASKAEAALIRLRMRPSEEAAAPW